MAPDPSKPLFPIYLLPSLSFPLRVRKHSSTSTTSESYETAVPYLSHSSSSSPSTSPSSPPSHLESLLLAALRNEPKAPLRRDRLHTALPSILRCITCASEIAFAAQIVSKGFTGRHGRAYLVGGVAGRELVNTKTGRSVTRELLTGTHVVADVSCVICGTVLGWKYVDAKETSQMYKIGKFILETKRVVMGVHWEDTGVKVRGAGDDEFGEDVEEGEEDVVVFDSEDEEECEDLFSGVWDATVVARRRKRKVSARKVKAYSEP